MRLSVRSLFAAALLCSLQFAFPSAARAVYVIDLSTLNLSLPANNPNNIVEIKLTGRSASEAALTGFKLHASIGDGSGAGTEPTFQAGGPLTGVDYTGSIWAASTFAYDVQGQTPIAGFPSLAQSGITFTGTGNTVTPQIGDTIVKLVIDTTGITSGTYALQLTGTEIGAPSEFIGFGGASVPITITNGQITVTAVPEPSTLALAGFAVAGIGCVVGRRRRGPAAG